MRIVFFGTTDFSANMLKALFDAGHKISLAITLPILPSERGHLPKPTPVKTLAESLGIRVALFDDMNSPALLSIVEESMPELGVVVAFKILPENIFAFPRFGTINVHPSILPDLRGPAPLRWALIRGYSKTGITIFRLNEKIDAGEILNVEKVDIGEDETYGELFDKIQPIAGNLLVKTVDEIERGCAKSSEQIGIATKAPKITRETSRIDWTKTNLEIHNLIRAMNPQPGAWTFLADGQILIFRTKPIDIEGEPGKVLVCNSKTGEMIVGCGKGSLRIIEIQSPGKKILDCKSFLCGSRVSEGDYFDEK